MLKVAIDGRSLRSRIPRGWDRYTIELVARLPKFGVQPVLLCRQGEPLAPEHVAAAGCPVLEIPARRVLEWEQWALPRRLAAERFDVYHAVAERGVPLLCPCPALLTLHSLTFQSYASLILSGQLSGTVEDYLGPAGSGLGSLYAQGQFRMADHIVAPSKFCADEIEKLLPAPASKITVTPLGIPQAFTSPITPHATISATLQRYGIRQPYLIYVGGYERHKNVAGLLKVWQKVSKERPDIDLVLVGTSHVPADLRASIEDSRVHFLLDVSDDLVPLYDGASLFLSMSWRESFCLPALEALSRGVPVVASRWGATKEVLGDSHTLVDPRDADEACRAILSLFRNRPSPESLRLRAAKFTWDTCAELTCGVYESMSRGANTLRAAARVGKRTAAAVRVGLHNLAS